MPVAEKKSEQNTEQKLEALRLILGHKQGLHEKQYLTAPQLGPDVIPRGAVVELLGDYKVEWLAQFLAQHSDLKVFWADRTQTVLPTALHQRGVKLSQITFAILAEQMVQPLRRAIQSQVFAVVIAPQIFDEIKVLQAFQLFTEKANCTFFLLGKDEPSKSWPISLQLHINKHIHKNEEHDFQIEVLKQRYGKWL